MQDVPGYLLRKGITFGSYFDPMTPARIDPETMVRVNYEIFFFGTIEERDRFLADPIQYCGMVTDPVTKRRFRPDAGSLHEEREGVVYLFQSRSSRSSFVREPEAYRLPGYRMASAGKETALR